MELPRDLSEIVRRALTEDLPSGDLTTESVVDATTRGLGWIVARQSLVFCGAGVLQEVFSQIDPDLLVRVEVPEGTWVAPGERLARLEGSIASILMGERVALNFVQRLSGIATTVRPFAEALDGSPVRLVDTRKTTPGIRSLEKYAVRIGGGHNHRMSLSDGLMIKDNHILAAGGIAAAIARAKESAHHLLAIQVEVTTLNEAHEAIDAGATVLLLDNFSVEELGPLVVSLRQRPEQLTLEASGGIRLETVAQVAKTGVDVISSGALIHQATWVDVALDLEKS